MLSAVNLSFQEMK